MSNIPTSSAGHLRKTETPISRPPDLLCGLSYHPREPAMPARANILRIADENVAGALRPGPAIVAGQAELTPGNWHREAN